MSFLYDVYIGMDSLGGCTPKSFLAAPKKNLKTWCLSVMICKLEK